MYFTAKELNQIFSYQQTRQICTGCHSIEHRPVLIDVPMQRRQPVVGLISVDLDHIADGFHARRHILPNAVYAHLNAAQLKLQYWCNPLNAFDHASRQCCQQPPPPGRQRPYHLPHFQAARFKVLLQRISVITEQQHMVARHMFAVGLRHLHAWQVVHFGDHLASIRGVNRYGVNVVLILIQLQQAIGAKAPKPVKLLRTSCQSAYRLI